MTFFDVAKKSSVEGLTEFLNNLDDSGSIKFTHEMETEGKLPFFGPVDYSKRHWSSELTNIQETDSYRPVLEL